ncbi:MAG: adenylate/guanylate cyclase [uncultured bacterium]|nr:MAG: adenylate/guanylate cyclase [uncultured bacterium]
MIGDGTIYRSRSGFFRLSFVVAVILLLTATLLTLILGQYHQELQSSIDDRSLNDAKVAMAELQSEMVESQVIQDSLEKFADLAGPALSFSGLKPDAIAAMEKEFRRVFPARSRLIWFSEKLEVITPAGQPEPDQKRAWQAFVKSVAGNPGLSVLDKKIADGFVKSNISDFLTADYFSSLSTTCQLIMFKGERNYIALVRLVLTGRNNGSGYLLALIPTNLARPLWLEERALRLSRQRNEIAGAYSLSRNQSVANSTISENLLHGFSAAHSAGRSYNWQNEVFYYSDKHFANPDLLLTVGLSKRPDDSMSEWVLVIAGVLLWLPGLACLLLPLTGITERALNWSLKTRFNLTTFAIIVLPLLTGGLTSAINTARISLEMQNEEFMQLDKWLADVEESVALQTTNLELHLRSSLISRYVDEEIDKSSARTIYDSLRNTGCEVAIIIMRDGTSYVASDLPPETIRQRNCYLISLNRADLKENGFALDVIDKTFPPPTRGFSDHILTKTELLQQDLQNRIRRFDLAGTSFSSFIAYIYDRSGKIKACLHLGFDHKAMQQKFLRNYPRLSTGSSARLYFASRLENAANRLPVSRKLRSIMNFSMMTGNSFRFIHEWNNESYLVCARPFNDIDSVGMAVKKVVVEGLNPRREQLITLLFTSLAAILTALLIVNFFSGFFLKPVLQLSDLAARVDGGDYSAQLVSGNMTDEISVLTRNFGQMIEGLMEKAEMRNYLRADLFEHAAGEQKIIAERVEVIILFAGLRNFSSFEDQVSPEEAMGVMSRFLAVCEKAVREHGGEIDKYIGETAMAAFKQRSGNQAERSAIAAALQIHRDMSLLRQENTYFASLTHGVGIASGSVIAGHIGSLHNRLDYTFIGDTVNLAARLEKMAGRAGSAQILVTRSLVEKTGNAFLSSILEPIAVKGKAGLIDVVSVSGHNPEAQQ